MTTLAQLHDCHSCNDERSIDQKKKQLNGGARRTIDLRARRSFEHNGCKECPPQVICQMLPE